MRFHSSLCVVVLLNIIIAVPGQSQPENATSLRGGVPFDFANLPPLPPTGFYAWCETPRGFCKVKGNAPIAPGSACYCAEYSGHTT